MGKEEELRILALEMWLYRRMLKIPWTAKMTNEEVLAIAKAEREILSNIQQRQMRLLGHTKKRWFRKISRRRKIRRKKIKRKTQKELHTEFNELYNL